MSLFGFNANKNPPTLTGIDTTSANQTINDLTITDKIIFEPSTSSNTGNLAFNMSVDPTTDNMTINTPSASSSIKFVQGSVLGQTPIFNINPTSLNYNVGSTLQTLPYSELNNIKGSTSNIQNQINSITNAYGVATGFWGSFYTKTTITNIQNSGVGDVQNACMLTYDANTNGFSLTDTNATYGGLYNSIVVNNTGIYSISYQIKASHSNTTNDNFRMWLRLNGSDIAQSVSITNLPAANGSPTAFQSSILNWIMKLNAGDKIQPMWSSNVSGIILPYAASYSNPTTTSQYPILVNIQQVVNTAVGPAGPQGAAGNNGSAATVSVGTTTTLSPATSATVTNTGTSNAAVLNFGIPQGIQGPQGAQGPKGDKGADGEVTTGQMNTAIAASSVATLAAAATAAAIYTDAAITANNLAVVAPLATRVGIVEGKTINQTAVAGVSTTFAGSVATDTVAATTANIGTVAADYINLGISMGGVGKINLSSTTGANTIYAPSTTIASTAGFGGVYLGGFTDTVYISGLPLSFYFGQW
jgi:hypothetical protein